MPAARVLPEPRQAGGGASLEGERALSADEFGKRAAFRFVLTPVIPGLVQKPIFGGK